MVKDALTITLGQLVDLLRGLGVEPDLENLHAVNIEAGRVTVVRYRRDDAGRMHLIPGTNDRATETVTIALVGAPPFCSWCPDPPYPDPARHPFGTAAHRETWK